MIKPLFGMPSQPAHVELSPPHLPQPSITLPLATLPSQPVHVDESPPHSLQPSNSLVL
jgi:hypothetical protein